MVGSTSSPDGMLLKRAQPWRGLARADDPGMSMGPNGVDESRRRRCNARQPAEQVQSHALRRENAPGRTLQPENGFSSFNAAAIGAVDGDRDGRVDQGECQDRRIDTSHHTWLPGDNGPPQSGLCGNDGIRRDVPGPAQILEQRRAHDRLHQQARERS